LRNLRATFVSTGEHLFALVVPLDDPNPEVAMPLPEKFDAMPAGIIQVGTPMIALAPGDVRLTASYDSWSGSVMLHVN
jgi:hypothetical protein